MAQFASRLVERLGNTVQNARLTRLRDDEKRAVLTLLNAVALSDGVLSASEDAAINKAAMKLGVNLTRELALPEAVAVLAKKPAALKLACLLVADAFFLDGDYDAQEKAFVASFSERFKLPENPLKVAVEALRRKKLDDALADWNKEIERTGS